MKTVREEALQNAAVQEAVTPAVAAAQAPPAQRDAGWFETAVRQFFPYPNYPKKLQDNDDQIFETYRQAIETLPYQDGHDNYSSALLTASQRIYDSELARRESINTRCAAALSTGGILGALVVAAGQLGLMQQKGRFGVAAWIVLILFIVSLLYLGISIAMALSVQGSKQGNVVDPPDLAHANQHNVSVYNVDVSRDYLRYTVENYKLDNRLKWRLHSSQLCLRNGIIAVIIAGALSPLALRTAAKATGALPAPTTTHQHVRNWQEGMMPLSLSE